MGEKDIRGGLVIPGECRPRNKRIRRRGEALLPGEHPDDLGSALDLAIQSLQRIVAVQLGAVLLQEAHAGQRMGRCDRHAPARRE